MNYATQKQKLLELIDQVEREGEWYRAMMIQNILRKADIKARTDVRQAHGILDRALKSKLCINLIREGEEE